MKDPYGDNVRRIFQSIEDIRIDIASIRESIKHKPDSSEVIRMIDERTDKCRRMRDRAESIAMKTLKMFGPPSVVGGIITAIIKLGG